MEHPLSNGGIAALFAEMADLLEIQGGDTYRIRAFRRIARVLENQREPVTAMLRHGTLAKVPGIAEGGVRRIKDILATGTCGDLRRLRAELGPGVRDLMKVRGIGAKTVKLLHGRGISSVAQLETMARAGLLRDLPGLTADKVLAAIEQSRKQVGRVPLPAALAMGQAMVASMREEPAVLRIELAGSARRRKATIGDLDLLVASNAPAAVMARFMSLPQVTEIVLKGSRGRASVRAENGQQVDLRVLLPEEFGAGLHYFTGSQQHNIYVRARGNRRGVKISDHGIFRRSDELRLSPGRHEEEIFAAIGLPFIPPELRENCGELEAAERGLLRVLVAEEQLRGDLHVATHGKPVADFAAAARRLGLDYLAICDPIDSLLAAAAVRKAEAATGVKLLRGAAVRILADGTLDADMGALRKLDWVLGVVDGEYDQPRAAMTQRLVRAMESGAIDCLAHPTNRIVDARDPCDVDLEKLFKAAVRCDVALEINADPQRLDLDDVSARRAREVGVMMAVNSGAASPDELARRVWGVYVARRGWLERKDVLNTQPVQVIEERRRDRLRKTAVATSAYAVAGGAAAAAAEAPAKKRAQERALEREIKTLAAQLKAPPLPAPLVARLEAFFASGNDAPLEAALKTISENPVQAAFSLLSGTADRVS